MKKRIFKKVLSIVLVCVMTLTSMGAYSGERGAMATSADYRISLATVLTNEADLFWSNGLLEEYVLERTFKSKANDTRSLQFFHSVVIEEQTNNEYNSLYVLNIVLGKQIVSIEMSGELELISFNNGIEAFCGTLRGDYVFDDGRAFSSFANIDYDEKNNFLFASITLQSTNKSIESAYFSIGKSFVTKDMWSVPEEKSVAAATSAENSINAISSGYIIRSSKIDDNGSISLYYNAADKRIAVSTHLKSNLISKKYIDANFYYVRTQVKSFKTGLKRDSYNSSSIVNMDSFPQNSSSSDFNEFLNTCEGLLTDLGVPSSLIAILKSISGTPQNSYQTLGSHTWGKITFSAGPSTEQVLFDNGEFAVAYNVTTTQSGAYWYTGYTEVEYLTMCVSAGSSAQLRYTDKGLIETSGIFNLVG